MNLLFKTSHKTITFLLVTLPNIHRFKKKFTHRLRNKPFLIWLLITSPHLNSYNSHSQSMVWSKARTRLVALVDSGAVFFLLPEAFCGLKYAENAIAAGAPPRTSLRELTTAPPDPLVGWGADTLSIPHPHSAPRCSRLRRLDRRAPLTTNPGDATACG